MASTILPEPVSSGTRSGLATEDAKGAEKKNKQESHPDVSSRVLPWQIYIDLATADRSQPDGTSSCFAP
jgi:hypothetical protein